MSRKLNQYAFNRYSQNGEDGIIEELCARLKLTPGWCVEFGAWNGKHLSNTYNLLRHHGWQGVHIEADAERYRDLLATKAELSGRLHTLCSLVEVQGRNSLDQLLATTPIPKEFELLSIDIDSVDAQIWESVQAYRPKVVVIECNMVLPPGVRQLHQPPKHMGASFTSLVELGRRKGYQLVCQTGNCMFVTNELVDRVGLAPELLQAPEKLFDWSKHRREKLLHWMRRILPEWLMNLVFKASFKWKQLRRKQG